uniref:Serpin peptidase inhibitor, clade A (alpha-1 antiproteinase, antitrypsin), member 10a n=2 Tax=Hucho hucho TaxID=62062 RepID=A0A4W5NL40_9TELE
MTSRLLPLLACIPLLAMPLLAQEPSAAEIQDLSTRNADFAARLYRAIASTTDDNVLLSPFTLSLGLAALMSGADGSTREQLLQGLSLNALDHLRIPELFQSVRDSMAQSGFVNQGIGILPRQQFKVDSSYRDVVQTKYGGNVQGLDYSDGAAKDTINQFFYTYTREQVKEVVSAIDPQTQMMLITAVFFQGQFALTFNTNFTQDERFYVNKYKIAMVPMMFRSDKYHLAYDRSLKLGVLKLPMTGGAAMLVLLPDEDVDYTSIDEEITGERFQGWLKQLKRTRLEVQLPRFMLEQSYSLQKVLPGFGISEVFQDSADFSGIGGETGLRLSEVVHKTTITVDETSSTGNDLAPNIFASLPPRLTVNRPFLFLIYHQATSSILFVGRVIDPTKKFY